MPSTDRHSPGRAVLVAALLVALVLVLPLSLLGLPSAAAEDEDAVTVVRELTERRTEYGTTYLLSNGLYRTVLSQAPVHYQDAAGVWQAVDTRLVATGDGGYAATAVPVAVRIGDPVEGVTLTCGGHEVGLVLAGAAADAVLSADGASATYLALAPATDLVYEVTGDGVKETLVLASSLAPGSFTFTLAHPGLALREGEDGTWGLYAPGAEEPVFLLGAVNAHDSSADEGGEPAWCDAAKLSVAPGKEESTVTVSVPRAWLDDVARVWPVKIDPQLFTRNPTDAYISSGHPNTKYGQSDAQNLLCGEISQNMGTCKTLVRFPQVDNPANIPSEAHVSAASFSIRQYWQPANPHDRTHAYRLYGTCTDWDDDVTWNSMDITGKQEIQPDNLDPHGQEWMDVACAGVIQGWVDGSFADRGFLIAQKSDEGSTYARKFRSGEYDVDWRPNLTVDWEEPTVASDSDEASYVVGDTVSVTVTLGAIAQSSQITEIRMGTNRLAASAEDRRGVFAWFASPPTDDAHWVYQSAGANGGYFAYYASTLYGIDHLEPLLDSCTISQDHKTVVFTFAANDTWGLAAACQMDTRLAMAAGSRTWTRGWEPQTQNTFTVDPDAGTPEALCSLSSTTTATSAWFIGTSPNDTTDQGRGTVTLSWPDVPLADSYTVYLWDGVKYDQVATTTQTSWTTPGNLYPTDTAIAAIASGYDDDPFADYGSRDLRDNPNPLYQKMAGSSNLDTDYRFKVVPYDAGTATSPSLDDCAPLRVTLDSRSVLDPSAEDARHVTYEFGEWDGHSVGVELDSGEFTLAVSDLEIASWGPVAALSRTYRSDCTALGRFARGWFFNFEQGLAVGANQIVYTDPARRTHTFTGAGSSWTAPNGFLASLAPDGSDWRLTFFDQSYLTFDASGVLTAETDAHGNQVSYVWTAGDLEITAANGQSITVDCDAYGAVVGASYATAAGTRSVAYTSAAPWQVSSYPGTAAARTLTYTYNTRRRYLMSLTQEAWPQSGQSATLSFDYNSVAGQLEAVYFADYDAQSKPDALATVNDDSSTQATITRYGTVDGTAEQPMNEEVFTWSGAGAGVPNQLATYTSGSGALAVTETYNYAFDRQLATTTSSEGGQTNDTVNLAHDVTSSTTTTGSLDAVNQVTASTYDALHRVVTETSYQDPAHYATTTNTYSGADLTATATVDQDATLLAAATYAYDTNGYGLMTEERHLVSGTIASGTWTQTDYDDYAACGEPETTAAQDVELSYGANPQDLTKTTSYDAFGNLLAATDWGGRATQTNTYDIAGRQLTSTDAGNVVSHTSYDCMGNAVESWTTASGTQMKADWTVTTYDALGRELTVTTKLSDANGNATTESVTTSSYDGSGNLMGADQTTLGGEDERTLYDASANATEEWAEGVRNYSDAGRSTRSVYDAEGNVTYESDVGNTNAPGSGATCTAYTYDDAGNELSVKEPDGSKKTYAYDGQGNAAVTEGEATGAGEFSPWDEATSYDASGRTVKEAAAAQSHAGLETTTTLDKLGRTTAQTAVRDGVTEQSTTTTYNDLGWVLESVDANGVTTQTTYDAHGAVVSQTIGTKTTTRSYNATTGRLETVTTADGATITFTYDAFGRVVRELHQQGGQTLKDIGGTNGTVLDSLGRPESQTEAVAAVTHSWTYPQDAASGTQETIAYDATPLTSLAITRNGRQMETARTATIASGVTATLATADTSAGRDSADRWKQRTIQRSGYAADTESRAFDDAGRLTTQSGLGFTSGKSASYAYDASTGKKTADYLPLALLDYPGSPFVSSSYTYYPGGSLAVATTNGSEESFTFDEVGNLVSDAVTDTGATTFAYDSANRLTRSDYLAATDGAAPVTTYYGWDSANAWRTCQGPTPSPTQANSPIDLSYNALGRLAAYANADTDTSAVYTYDAAGQRTKSTVTVGGVTTTTSFAYDGLTLLKLSAVQGASTWRIDYLYDEEGVPWGGVYRSPATSTSPVYFSLVTSDRGDVAELCDADGDAFAAYRYDAWGLPQGSGTYATGVWTQATNLVNSTLAGEIASRQVLRYASYAWDAESALYYCSARYYDPATRQWTTGDPAKADGEESAYQYCGGGPVESVDPSGEDTRITFHFPSPGNATTYFKRVLRIDAGWARAAGKYATYKASSPRGKWDFKLLLSKSEREKRKWGFRTPVRPDTYWKSWYEWLGKGRLEYRYGATYGGSRTVSADDFGNVHFGYVCRAIGISLWAVRTVSISDSHANSPTEYEDETRDLAMITWGFKLYPHWGRKYIHKYYSRFSPAGGGGAG
jgi:RHS repeat-associated protein